MVDGWRLHPGFIANSNKPRGELTQDLVLSIAVHQAERIDVETNHDSLRSMHSA
jgi:hypothetical protein